MIFELLLYPIVYIAMTIMESVENAISFIANVIPLLYYSYIKPIFKSHIYRISLITLIGNTYLLKMYGPPELKKYLYLAIGIFFIVNLLIGINRTSIDKWLNNKNTTYRGFDENYKKYTKSFEKTSPYSNENTDKNRSRTITNPFLGKNAIEAKVLYRKLSKKYHPDQETGDAEMYAEINRMYDEFKKTV